LRAANFTSKVRYRACPERKAGQGIWQTRIPSAQPFQGMPRVFDLPGEIAVRAFAATHATEVEAQHDSASGPQGARQTIYYLVVHCAAVQRMRMTGERGEARLLLGLFQQRL